MNHVFKIIIIIIIIIIIKLSQKGGRTDGGERESVKGEIFIFFFRFSLTFMKIGS